MSVGHYESRMRIKPSRNLIGNESMSSDVGIETEVLYQLMTFGIPPSSVPWVAGGSKHHERWLAERQWIESPSRFTDMDLEYDSEGDDIDDDDDDLDDHADRDTGDT